VGREVGRRAAAPAVSGAPASHANISSIGLRDGQDNASHLIGEGLDPAKLGMEIA
jgi:hypothetical protein